MKIPIYQVDAFTSEIFKGNPAAVCPLNEWLSEKIMQEIAKENNLLNEVEDHCFAIVNLIEASEDFRSFCAVF